ncbi:MAG: glycosyltransferase [Chloroflexota bacterium]|nr:glycosyltransferase [Chloroflexota bacterium]
MLSHTEARAVKHKLARTSFDLIHTFGYSPATAAAIKMRRDLKIPLVLELVNPLRTPYQYLPGTRTFTKQDLSHQSLIVAISKSLGDMCASFGIVDNVWVRPNPVDTNNFSIPTEQERTTARKKISSVPENGKLIVYAAKYLTRKNHAFLLDVLTKLPESFNLVLAGPPLTDRDLVPGLKADQIPTLKKHAQELGIDKRVVISHGFVDMAKYMAAADIFCFPAEREAMGTPILESISSGVPVVANADESSFQEWVKDGKNGYLCPLITEKWAEAIVKASKFSHDKKLIMSEEIKSTVSTDLIDEQYYKLLTALASTKYLDQLNVKQVLSL